MIIASSLDHRQFADLLLMTGAIPHMSNFWGCNTSLFDTSDSNSAFYSLLTNTSTQATVDKIIGEDCFVVDNAFPDEFLDALVRLWNQLPTVNSV